MKVISFFFLCHIVNGLYLEYFSEMVLDAVCTILFFTFYENELAFLKMYDEYVINRP